MKVFMTAFLFAGTVSAASLDYNKMDGVYNLVQDNAHQSCALKITVKTEPTCGLVHVYGQHETLSMVTFSYINQGRVDYMVDADKIIFGYTGGEGTVVTNRTYTADRSFFGKETVTHMTKTSLVIDGNSVSLNKEMAMVGAETTTESCGYSK